MSDPTATLHYEPLPDYDPPSRRPPLRRPPPRYPLLTGVFRGLVLAVLAVAVCATWFAAGVAYASLP